MLSVEIGGVPDSDLHTLQKFAALSALPNDIRGGP